MYYSTAALPQTSAADKINISATATLLPLSTLQRFRNQALLPEQVHTKLHPTWVTQEVRSSTHTSSLRHDPPHVCVCPQHPKHKPRHCSASVPANNLDSRLIAHHQHTCQACGNSDLWCPSSVPSVWCEGKMLDHAKLIWDKTPLPCLAAQNSVHTCSTLITSSNTQQQHQPIPSLPLLRDKTCQAPSSKSNTQSYTHSHAKTPPSTPYHPAMPVLFKQMLDTPPLPHTQTHWLVELAGCNSRVKPHTPQSPTTLLSVCLLPWPAATTAAAPVVNAAATHTWASNQHTTAPTTHPQLTSCCRISMAHKAPNSRQQQLSAPDAANNCPSLCVHDSHTLDNGSAPHQATSPYDEWW